MEDLNEKLWKLEEKFYSDEEVISLINQLKTRFKTLESEVFTEEEFDSDEYSQLCEEYYINCREDWDPDDYGIFTVMWFD